MHLLWWDGKLLGSAPAPLGASLDDEGLLACYRPPTNGWVRANMVSTLDGAATDSHGVSGGINTPADQVVFGLLRSLCDVVVVGAGTVRAEGYTRLSDEPRWASVRRSAGWPAPPVLAILTRSSDLPDAVLEPSPTGGALLVLAHPTIEEAALDGLRERVGADAVHRLTASDPTTIVAVLRERGLSQVLSEGGPTLLSQFLTSGAVQELCVTITPRLVLGSSRRITTGPPGSLSATPALLVEHEGTVMGRWLLAGEPVS